MFFLLVLFVVQFNNCFAFSPRSEFQDLPLAILDTCQAQVSSFGSDYTPNSCRITFQENECVSGSSKIKWIKDCPECKCLQNGRMTDNYTIPAKVRKINPQLVERIEKSNTFEVAGFVVPDSLYYVTVSVIGISTFGMLAYTFPLGLILVPLAIAWLLSILLGHSLILGIGPEIERSPEEYAALFVLAFIPAQVMSIFILPLVLLQTPLVIWTLPQKIREFEIEAIKEKVYAFELEDLYE